MPTNESGLQAQVRKAIATEYPDCWVFNVVGSPYQMAGVPDLLVCVQGLLIGLELKFQRPSESRQHASGRASPQQRVQIMRINRAGGAAGVVVSVEEAFDLIERGLKKHREKEQG